MRALAGGLHLRSAARSYDPMATYAIGDVHACFETFQGRKGSQALLAGYALMYASMPSGVVLYRHANNACQNRAKGR
jgi:hypothetical protein